MQGYQENLLGQTFFNAIVVTCKASLSATQIMHTICLERHFLIPLQQNATVRCQQRNCEGMLSWKIKNWCLVFVFLHTCICICTSICMCVCVSPLEDWEEGATMINLRGHWWRERNQFPNEPLGQTMCWKRDGNNNSCAMILVRARSLGQSLLTWSFETKMELF